MGLGQGLRKGGREGCDKEMRMEGLKQSRRLHSKETMNGHYISRNIGLFSDLSYIFSESLVASRTLCQWEFWNKDGYRR